MFIDPGIHHDPHAERRAAAAADRTRRALTRSRRLHRWADRSARLADLLDRRARDGRPSLDRPAVTRRISAA